MRPLQLATAWRLTHRDSHPQGHGQPLQLIGPSTVGVPLLHR